MRTIRSVRASRLRRLAGRRAAQLRRGRRARARARRGIHGAAGSGVSRLPGIARRQPRVFLVVAQFTAADRRDASTTRRAPSTGARTSIPSRTLACDFSGKHPEITHTRFGALRLKDAICDQLRDATRQPPGHRAPSGPRCACTRMPTARTSPSPSTCRVKVCIGAVIARRPARRRCARISPPES